MQTKEPDWAAIRREFPTLNKWAYLDTANKAPLPLAVQRATQEFFKDMEENIGRDVLSPASVEGTRTTMARLLGAPKNSISFIKNTSEGLNIASHALDLVPGDNIVVTDMEHRANLWVWDHWREKGVEIRSVQNRDGRLPVEAFQEKIDEKTRVVATSWVTYRNGYRIDVPALSEVCRERGAKLVIDGVQGAGLLDTPLPALGADFIAMSSHKHLLGLTGTGVLYVRPEIADELSTGITKTRAFFTPNWENGFERYDQHRFEAGNPSFIGLRVLRRSAEFLESIGLDRIEARVRYLTDEFLKMLKKRGIRTQTPQEWRERCQIVNVLIDTDTTKLAKELQEKHVALSVRDGILRVSMSFFNNEEDLERLLHALPR